MLSCHVIYNKMLASSELMNLMTLNQMHTLNKQRCFWNNCIPKRSLRHSKLIAETELVRF